MTTTYVSEWKLQFERQSDSVRAVPVGSRIEEMPDEGWRPTPRPLGEVLRAVDAGGLATSFDLFWDYVIPMREAERAALLRG